MDIRGIEVTNQLRSAIRAKLLELGVRYDEELPDYILVMVVNKKTRQQMHEDLHLFLEESTTTFVEWLHDQVLKKLQKVTVAKKKSSREFVPTVVVKQEEERRKRKTSATSFLEDQGSDQGAEKTSEKVAKLEKSSQKTPIKVAPAAGIAAARIGDAGRAKSPDKSGKAAKFAESRTEQASTAEDQKSDDVSSKQAPAQSVDVRSGGSSQRTPPRLQPNAKILEAALKGVKRLPDATASPSESAEKSEKPARQANPSQEREEPNDSGSKRLKSSVNKPRITSVVSVKNRLGCLSPRKKFEVHRNRMTSDACYRLPEKRFDKGAFDSSARRNDFSQERNFDPGEAFRRSREPIKFNDAKHRLGNAREEKSGKGADPKDRSNAGAKTKDVEKPVVTIKDRLGVGSNTRVAKPSTTRTLEQRNSKFPEENRLLGNSEKSIRNRLGPVKGNFGSSSSKGFDVLAKSSRSSEDDDRLHLGSVEDDLDGDARSSKHAALVKSHIVAVKRRLPLESDRKRPKLLHKAGRETSSDVEDDEADCKVPSKVIVTPRPLKPLQPNQKRATQSLLLRAVAEANQSVVTQKNPEPALADKKLSPGKRLKPAMPRDIGQNLSVHLNASKRLVMEKIQVELTTEDSYGTDATKNAPKGVTDEQMGVVKSLFQRSDDGQKFLVTLNGYNNVSKGDDVSDDEELLDVEVNEDDECTLSNINADNYTQDKTTSSDDFQSVDCDDVDVCEKRESKENNENRNTENVAGSEGIARKRRKLSPIVYERSNSPSPVKVRSVTPVGQTSVRLSDKRPSEDSIPSIAAEKSKDKCRYWPNCTLGIKCAYYHPAVPCSAFPTCKFGDKCAYKHPKCKFGLSCTKLGCVFSHPVQQCKYHPYCTKPACPYSHPAAVAALPVENAHQRAKFTWRRRD